MKRKRSPEDHVEGSANESKSKTIKNPHTMTIKCSLKSILKPEIAPELMRLFSDYVYRISNMAVEASRLINLYILWRLKKTPDDPMPNLDATFIDNAFIIVSWMERKEKTIEKSEAVKELRYVFEKHYKPCKPPNMEPVYRDQLTHFRYSAREQLQTAARNHVMTNFWKRTVEWIKLKIESRKVSVKVTKKQLYEISKIIYSLSTALEEKERVALKDKVSTMEKEDKEAFTKNYQNSEMIEWAYIFADANAEFFKRYEMEKPTDYNLGHVDKWFKYLPWLYCILVDFEKLHGLHQSCKTQEERNGLPSMKERRLFTLFPEHKLRPLHISLDNTTVEKMDTVIYQANADSAKRNGKWPEVKRRSIEDLVCRDSKYFTWSKILDMNKLPKSGNSSKFAYFFSTDGINASLLFEKQRKVGVRSDFGEGKVLKSIEPIEGGEQLSVQEFTALTYEQRIVAIDPGRRNLFLGIDNKGKVIKCTAKRYYSMAGFKERLKKQKSWLRNDSKIDVAIKSMPTSRTSVLKKYKAHLEHLLPHLRGIMLFFCQNKQKRLRFTSYIRQQRALDNLCREITGGRRETIVAYGDAGFSGTAKGHSSTPNKLFKQRLQAHCDNVVMVDEFRTSKACHNCRDKGYIQLVGPIHRQITWKVRKKDGSTKKVCRRIAKNIEDIKVLHEPPKEAEDVKETRFPIHGLRVCPNCHKTLSRDLNAAKNIMEQYLWQWDVDLVKLLGERPAYLARSVHDSETTKKASTGTTRFDHQSLPVGCKTVSTAVMSVL